MLKYLRDPFKLPNLFRRGNPPPVPPGGSDNPPAGDTAPPTNNPATDTAAGDTPPPAPPRAPVADWRDKQINRRAPRSSLEGEAGWASGLGRKRTSETEFGGEKRDYDASRPGPNGRCASNHRFRPSVGDPKAQARFEIELENIKTKIDTEYAKDWPEAEENPEKPVASRLRSCRTFSPPTMRHMSRSNWARIPAGFRKSSIYPRPAAAMPVQDGAGTRWRRSRC